MGYPAQVLNVGVGLFRFALSSIVLHPFMKAPSFVNPSIQKNSFLVFLQAEEGGTGKSATALYDYQASKLPLMFFVSVTK